ncbi:hypothetical protein [Leptospira sp. GIMC2001]|uniref:hypothetical protein n=1 Tax=Leptospira sp. GIMC2001 TaxID=1513297 RepID=UPI00234B6B5B|nr:hypothetical protein [Leptospira sp. GIMC2001]WCL49246.1 hypothetical protein O4O04_18430 [Leptospira sp. GIMC2001]
MIRTWLNLLSIGLILANCQKTDFNTDFPPPDEGVKIGAIYPSSIGGIDPKFEFLPDNDDKKIFGHRAKYGDYAEIQSIETKDTAILDQFFESKILENYFKGDFKTKASGKFNNNWIGRGTLKDGTRVYAWSNKNWIYLIKAKDEGAFREVIRGFPFISED